MSRGGVNEYIWATANPDKVSCIYADNPALRPESLLKIGELAKNDVPLLHICGSLDFLLQQHSLAVENIYHQLGGRITMMIKEGVAHHPHSLRDPQPIADWIVKNVERTSDTPPAFAGKKFTKSYYYSIEDSYTLFPKEKTYVTCRGPLFTECYDRYDVKTDSQWGITAMTVIVPKTAAPGKPWVFRADRIGRDAEVVDLALLAKGFHIVAAPVTAQSGPVREQWDAVYKLLTDNGFSRKPVMEGAGTAAGEAYAWAIENPDKVSCIYGENPALRSLMSKKPPLDHLAPLAKAGVPLIHVCGSLDPWLNDQTRVVEKRYKELGGQITVIVKEGEGHYPLAPKDPKAVVEFGHQEQFVFTNMNPFLTGLILLVATAHFDDAPAGRPLEQSLLDEDPVALANAVRGQGDPARGAVVFYQPFLSCTKCHAAGDGRGDTLGPDLAKLGKEVTDAYLIESVLRPSKVIKKGFETVTIATTDGKNVTGLLAEERADRRDPPRPGAGRETGHRLQAKHRRADGQRPVGHARRPGERARLATAVPRPDSLPPRNRRRRPRAAKALRPDPSQVAGLKLPDYESKIDHAGMIAGLGPESLERGEAIYNRVCVNCHGTKDKPGSMPTSLRFASGRFKNGSDPYSLYRTLTHGFGQMPPQTWMVPVAEI